MPFTLPTLNYDYKALEPHIDEQTMTIHHTKHNQGYVDKLNAACTNAGLDDPSWDDLFKVHAQVDTAIRNNGGGAWNHAFFWDSMSPTGGGEPSGSLLEAINTTFGSFADFKTQFSAAAASRFGSGWAWLGVKSDGTLAICSTPNQDNPMMIVDTVSCTCTPILGLDVWEHAYYLNYQNKRGDYVAAFFNVVDWGKVQERYNAAVQAG